eukprot:m.36691 g.36691  ORF g.36691 m.36691 type:complete len:96 (-) comp16067_c0_seq2:229-516(-)
MLRTKNILKTPLYLNQLPVPRINLFEMFTMQGTKFFHTLRITTKSFGDQERFEVGKHSTQARQVVQRDQPLTAIQVQVFHGWAHQVATMRKVVAN